MPQDARSRGGTTWRSSPFLAVKRRPFMWRLMSRRCPVRDYARSRIACPLRTNTHSHRDRPPALTNDERAGGVVVVTGRPWSFRAWHERRPCLRACQAQRERGGSEARDRGAISGPRRWRGPCRLQRATLRRRRGLVSGRGLGILRKPWCRAASAWRATCPPSWRTGRRLTGRGRRAREGGAAPPPKTTDPRARFAEALL
jgi:hypothetical protein